MVPAGTEPQPPKDYRTWLHELHSLSTGIASQRRECRKLMRTRLALVLFFAFMTAVFPSGQGLEITVAAVLFGVALVVSLVMWSASLSESTKLMLAQELVDERITMIELVVDYLPSGPGPLEE